MEGLRPRRAVLQAEGRGRPGQTLAAQMLTWCVWRSGKWELTPFRAALEGPCGRENSHSCEPCGGQRAC